MRIRAVILFRDVEHCGIDSAPGINSTDSGIEITSNFPRFRNRWEFRGIRSNSAIRSDSCNSGIGRSSREFRGIPGDSVSIQFPELRSGVAHLFQRIICSQNVKCEGEGGKRFRCGIPESLVIPAIPESVGIPGNSVQFHLIPETESIPAIPESV